MTLGVFEFYVSTLVLRGVFEMLGFFENEGKELVNSFVSTK